VSKKSNVPGKTVEQLRRSAAGAERQAKRESRTAVEQLAVLDQRPGSSARERRRLSA
jgi:hypothetical protein